jgi:hypothetical protein
VELTGLAGDALRDDLGVFVNQNRHVLTSVRLASRRCAARRDVLRPRRSRAAIRNPG